MDEFWKNSEMKYKSSTAHLLFFGTQEQENIAPIWCLIFFFFFQVSKKI